MRPNGLLLAGLACISAAAPAAPTQPVIIVAHRGLAEGMPENTLAAFRQSIDRGLAIIELDVRTTRDGQLVILHDETLDRTTDCSGRLADLSLAWIKNCDAGAPGHPGERIPTLAEALELVHARPARLLLDIKPGTSVRDVLRIVRDDRAETSVILGLRRADQVAIARHELPGAAILGFIPEPGDAPAFARAGAHIIRLWSDWIDADPSHIGRVQSLGPKVWVMIGRRLPSKKEQWRSMHARMLATGAEGLITDRPELIGDRP